MAESGQRGSRRDNFPNDGVALRQVKLAPGSVRGGLLTQASVLKVTSNGTTTSPVKRGVWIMTRLIGKPPLPPEGGAFRRMFRRRR